MKQIYDEDTSGYGSFNISKAAWKPGSVHEATRSPLAQRRVKNSRQNKTMDRWGFVAQKDYADARGGGLSGGHQTAATPYRKGKLSLTQILTSSYANAHSRRAIEMRILEGKLPGLSSGQCDLQLDQPISILEPLQLQDERLNFIE